MGSNALYVRTYIHTYMLRMGVWSGPQRSGVTGGEEEERGGGRGRLRQFPRKKKQIKLDSALSDFGEGRDRKEKLRLSLLF